MNDEVTRNLESFRGENNYTVKQCTNCLRMKNEPVLFLFIQNITYTVVQKNAVTFRLLSSSITLCASTSTENFLKKVWQNNQKCHFFFLFFYAASKGLMCMTFSHFFHFCYSSKKPRKKFSQIPCDIPGFRVPAVLISTRFSWDNKSYTPLDQILTVLTVIM